MRNFIIVLFALGLIGCVGCTDADPSTYNHCGIPHSSQAGFRIYSSNDGMNIVCNANEEDLDPTDLCTSHNSLCGYWSCLLSYSTTSDRIDECAGPLGISLFDAGTNLRDVHGGDVGIDTGGVDTGEVDTGSPDTGVDASEDVSIVFNEETEQRMDFFDLQCTSLLEQDSEDVYGILYEFSSELCTDYREETICQAAEDSAEGCWTIEACETFCHYFELDTSDN